MLFTQLKYKLYKLAYQIKIKEVVMNHYLNISLHLYYIAKKYKYEIKTTKFCTFTLYPTWFNNKQFLNFQRQAFAFLRSTAKITFKVTKSL